MEGNALRKYDKTCLYRNLNRQHFPALFVLKGVIKDCVMRRPRQATSLYEGVAYGELFSCSQLNVTVMGLMNGIGGEG